MTPPIITFFNNKGGVGKTSTLFNLSYMMAEQGRRVLAVDLDPQANLTSLCLHDELLVQLWGDEQAESAMTIYHAVQPVIDATGDFSIIKPQIVSDPPTYLLIPGDLRLSEFEDKLAVEWNNAQAGNSSGVNVTSVFYRLIQQVAQRHEIDVVFIDAGPNLGAINRAVLIASEYVIVPLMPDLFSLQGLRNVGRFLNEWRNTWSKGLSTLRSKRPDIPADMYPEGKIQPIGYVLLQHRERQNRLVAAHQRWAERIPATYSEHLLGQPLVQTPDPNALGQIRNYQSLAAMAQAARKPLYELRAGDGAIGSHVRVVDEAHQTYSELAHEVARRIGLPPVA
jgi:cellulose biosynthesis protein BcsQ